VVIYLALIALPLVRYEGLAISLPVLAYLFIKGEKTAAIASACALVAAMLAFSIFLRSKGLGLLPSSVLAKSSHEGWQATGRNLAANLQQYGFLLVVVVLLGLARWRDDKWFAAMLATASALHFAFGKYGWYGRYEVYYVAFVVVLGLKQLLRSDARWWPVAGTLPFAFTGLVYPTLTTPLAASNIYNQQAQMAKIATILNARVAVNDLGLVAFKSNNYVLDLWGLGSLEALQNRRNGKGSEWISAMMEAKEVNYAMIYDNWLPARPAQWIKVAELRLLQERITPGSDVVAFYATSVGAAANLREAIAQFSRVNHSKEFAIHFVDPPRAQVNSH
jgi:hypothetical protein